MVSGRPLAPLPPGRGPAPYCLTIYSAENGEPVTPGLAVTFFPFPGLEIMYGHDWWLVERIQVVLPYPGSPAEKAGGPTMIDVVATRRGQ